MSSTVTESRRVKRGKSTGKSLGRRDDLGQATFDLWERANRSFTQSAERDHLTIADSYDEHGPSRVRTHPSRGGRKKRWHTDEYSTDEPSFPTRHTKESERSKPELRFKSIANFHPRFWKLLTGVAVNSVLKAGGTEYDGTMAASCVKAIFKKSAARNIQMTHSAVASEVKKEMIKIGCSLFLATAAAIEVNATIIDKFDTVTGESGCVEDDDLSRSSFTKYSAVDTRDDVTNFAHETCSKVSAHPEKISVMEALFQENNLLKAAMERMIEHAHSQKDEKNSTIQKKEIDNGRDDINCREQGKRIYVNERDKGTGITENDTQPLKNENNEKREEIQCDHKERTIVERNTTSNCNDTSKEEEFLRRKVEKLEAQKEVGEAIVREKLAVVEREKRKLAKKVKLIRSVLEKRSTQTGEIEAKLKKKEKELLDRIDAAAKVNQILVQEIKYAIQAENKQRKKENMLSTKMISVQEEKNSLTEHIDVLKDLLEKNKMLLTQKDAISEAERTMTYKQLQQLQKERQQHVMTENALNEKLQKIIKDNQLLASSIKQLQKKKNELERKKEGIRENLHVSEDYLRDIMDQAKTYIDTIDTGSMGDDQSDDISMPLEFPSKQIGHGLTKAAMQLAESEDTRNHLTGEGKVQNISEDSFTTDEDEVVINTPWIRVNSTENNQPSEITHPKVSFDEASRSRSNERPKFRPQGITGLSSDSSRQATGNKLVEQRFARQQVIAEQEREMRSKICASHLQEAFTGTMDHSKSDDGDELLGAKIRRRTHRGERKTSKSAVKRKIKAVKNFFKNFL